MRPEKASEILEALRAEDPHATVVIVLDGGTEVRVPGAVPLGNGLHRDADGILRMRAHMIVHWESGLEDDDICGHITIRPSDDADDVYIEVADVECIYGVQEGER